MAPPAEPATDGAPRPQPTDVTLSKASLYAPLAAFGRDDGTTAAAPGGGGAAARPPKPPGPALREPALHEFLARVSRAHHRSGPRSLPRNTANRPLGVAEVRNRLQQRALTLGPGGGAGRGSSGAAAAPVGPASRKRRRCASMPRREEVRLLNAQSPAWKRRQYEFLRELNALWSDYLRRRMAATTARDPGSPASASLGREDEATVARRCLLAAAAPDMEWVGARVRIDACRAHPHWAQREGVLVATTSRAWKLMEGVRRDSSATNEDYVKFQVLIVPKQGSSLICLFSLDEDGTSGIVSRNLCIHLREDDDSTPTK